MGRNVFLLLVVGEAPGDARIPSRNLSREVPHPGIPPRLAVAGLYYLKLAFLLCLLLLYMIEMYVKHQGLYGDEGIV
jgi:hypothetical protein